MRVSILLKAAVCGSAMVFIAGVAPAADGGAAAGKTWLLWDGKESVAAYARRAGLKATDTLDLGSDLKLELVLIPAGKFLMGRAAGEAGRPDSENSGWELPRHEVTITRPFYLGKYEVRQDQYTAVMPNVAPAYQEPRHADWPASGVNWPAARRFCEAAKARTGKDVRLPTEAEWEYACRAGTTNTFYDGATLEDLAKAAWYGGFTQPSNSGPNNHPVGLKEPNAFGLYDMLANVQEWCQDWWSTGYYAVSPVLDPPGPKEGDGVADTTRHVVRGGSARDDIPATMNMRCACRGGSHAVDAPYDDRFGFRVAVTLPPGKP